MPNFVGPYIHEYANGSKEVYLRCRNCMTWAKVISAGPSQDAYVARAHEMMLAVMKTHQCPA